MKKVLSLSEQKHIEIEIVNELIMYFSSDIDLNKIVYVEWTKKDVLAHIASWHMSFANNLLAAVNNDTPTPFKGSLTDINEKEVSRLRLYSVFDLLDYIKKAQIIIETNIENEIVKEIVYKRGSRNYSPLEHLEVVSRHIKGHLDDLRKIE